MREGKERKEKETICLDAVSSDFQRWDLGTDGLFRKNEDGKTCCCGE